MKIVLFLLSLGVMVYDANPRRRGSGINILWNIGQSSSGYGAHEVSVENHRETSPFCQAIDSNLYLYSSWYLLIIIQVRSTTVFTNITIMYNLLDIRSSSLLDLLLLRCDKVLRLQLYGSGDSALG